MQKLLLEEVTPTNGVVKQQKNRKRNEYETCTLLAFVNTQEKMAYVSFVADGSGTVDPLTSIRGEVKRKIERGAEFSPVQHFVAQYHPVVMELEGKVKYANRQTLVEHWENKFRDNGWTVVERAHRQAREVKVKRFPRFEF